MSKLDALRALRETGLDRTVVKPADLERKSKEVMPHPVARPEHPATQPDNAKPPSVSEPMPAGACPVCEARRLKHAEAQKRYRQNHAKPS